MYIVNFSSGKGGTGKTLLVSVLADLLSAQNISTLIIDLDIFVRGLTSLLYFDSEETLNLMEKNQYAVSDIIMGKTTYSDTNLDKILIVENLCIEDENLHIGAIEWERLGVSKYHNFDVLPAVPRIDELLSYEDIMPANFEVASERLGLLMRSIRKDYDLILLDSRAGYDELIAATHKISDATICVDEEDQIAKVTSENLIRQLENVGRTPVYSLTNKTRRAYKGNFKSLGSIPFDVDIMDSYGSDKFWVLIKGSLLEPSLINSWNQFCRREGLKFELESSRVSTLPLEQLEIRIAKLSRFRRVSFLYGTILALFGIILAFSGEEFLMMILSDPIRASGIVIGIIGFFMAALSVLKR